MSDMSGRSRKSRRKRSNHRARRSDYIITIDENAVFEFSEDDEMFGEDTSSLSHQNQDLSSGVRASDDVSHSSLTTSALQGTEEDDSNLETHSQEQSASATTKTNSTSSADGRPAKEKKSKTPSHLVMVLPLPPDSANPQKPPSIL